MVITLNVERCQEDLIPCEGKMERQVDRRIGTASPVMRSLYRSVVVVEELS